MDNRTTIAIVLILVGLGLDATVAFLVVGVVISLIGFFLLLSRRGHR